jgi:hypothetical protein
VSIQEGAIMLKVPGHLANNGMDMMELNIIISGWNHGKIDKRK